MASIQQSLNQMLGAAAGAATMGSYMIRQSPSYQASQLDKRADKLLKYEVAQTGEKTGEAYEEARNLEVEAAKLHPTKKRVARASEIWEERAEEAEAKAKAEQSAINRLQNTIEAQTEQKNGLKDRFDMLREVLSAKERGQLDTMYNRHKNKGELD